MSAQSHIPIFNTRPTSGNLTYYLFPCFPKELRLLIWRHALRRQRIIKLHLSNPDLPDPATYMDRVKSINYNAARADNSIARYSVTIDGFQVLSKFLRVCKESRQESLLFYRAHIPCRFARLGKYDSMSRAALDRKTTLRTLYFNPEWDFLRISCWPNTIVLLPPFWHDLKTRYDPRGIGLLNLVITDEHDDGADVSALEPSMLLPEIRNSFEQTLRQLHEVFFHQNAQGGRMNLGILLRDVSSDTWFNRSFPISTEIPNFDRFSSDPRPISNDLKTQWMGNRIWRDPYHSFAHTLSKFSISAAQVTTQFKFMISYDATMLGNEIRNREDAEKWLKNDHEQYWIDRSSWPPYVQKVFEGEDYAMESKPAFGFWLFPLEAINAETIDRSGISEGLGDMRMYSPELGLAVMP